jgi:hypothetical protein
MAEFASSGGLLMTRRIRGKAVAGKASPPDVDQKIQEERQRIAEDIARALREAGYECSHDRTPTLRPTIDTLKINATVVPDCETLHRSGWTQDQYYS